VSKVLAATPEQLTVNGVQLKAIPYEHKEKPKTEKKPKIQPTTNGATTEADDDDDDDDVDIDGGIQNAIVEVDNDIDDEPVENFVPAVTFAERWPVVSVHTLAACDAAKKAIDTHKSVAVGVIGDVKGDSSSFVRLVSVAVMTEPSLAHASPAQVADTSNSSHGTVYVFDLHTDVESMLAIHKLLTTLLENDDVTKVMCDARHSLPALKDALRLGATTVNNVYDTLVAYRLLRRLLKRPLSDTLACLTDVDAMLALELPLSLVADLLPTSGSLWHNEPLLDVQLEFAAERVRPLLSMRARIQVELTKHTERLSDATLRYYVERERCDPLGVLPAGEVLAMAFESDVSDAGAVRIVAHRGVNYVKSSATAWANAVSARLRAAAEASRPDVLALLDAMPSVLRAAVLKFADNNPTEFAVRVHSIHFRVGQPARLQLRQPGAFEVLRECVWNAEQFKQFQASLGEKGLISAVVDAVPLRRSLHRVAIERDEAAGLVVGFRCRVVLPLTGAVSLLRDVVAHVQLSQKAVLFFGPELVGKSTVLRELSQELAKSKRTFVVDTVGDIGGDARLRDAALGDARVLRVPPRRSGATDEQVTCIREAIGNWSAECVVVDELTTEAHIACVEEVKASGAGVVCGMRATSLKTLYATYGVLQRSNPFDLVIEIDRFDHFTLHSPSVAAPAAAASQPAIQRWCDTRLSCNSRSTTARCPCQAAHRIAWLLSADGSARSSCNRRSTWFR
jgi:stage III sporulation protein SpoIIIAA